MRVAMVRLLDCAHFSWSSSPTRSPTLETLWKTPASVVNHHRRVILTRIGTTHRLDSRVLRASSLGENLLIPGVRH
jgi:hypothetical protein